MLLPEPTAELQRSPAVLTINLGDLSRCIRRSVVEYIAEALKEKAWHLSGGDEDDHDDAVYIESIADAVAKANRETDESETNDIRNVLG